MSSEADESPSSELYEIRRFGKYRAEGWEWGFRIYRCTYADGDGAWDRFMKCFKECTRQSLIFEKGEDLWPTLCWDVVEDRSLEGVESGEIRRRFRKWYKEDKDSNLDHDMDYLRGDYCIFVDKPSLDSVLFSIDINSDYFGMEEHINVLERRWGDDDSSDSDTDSDDDIGSTTSDFSEIEGCTRYRVGFVRISLIDYIPRLYNMLYNGGFGGTYSRPPEVASV